MAQKSPCHWKALTVKRSLDFSLELLNLKKKKENFVSKKTGSRRVHKIFQKLFSGLWHYGNHNLFIIKHSFKLLEAIYENLLYIIENSFIIRKIKYTVDWLSKFKLSKTFCEFFHYENHNLFIFRKMRCT